MNIKAIKTEQDYQDALKRLEVIFDAAPNTKEGDELEILAALIDDYENIHFPIDLPDPPKTQLGKQMTGKSAIHKIITFIIATVWLANGLFCKVLNFVPRHERIVARILGDEHAGFLTKVIGIAEILMALWILSGIKSRLNAMAQILIVATMNTIEFVLAPDLLLWGKANAIFAFIFILLIYYNEFVLNKKLALQA